ncbi:phage baseplate assembly protein W [Bradyrhizobium sp. USDA 3397]
MRADRYTAGAHFYANARDGELTAMHVDYPFHFDGRTRTATTGDDDYIRDLIEQVLFTGVGERVNRPDFGSGVSQLVFAPNTPELAASTQFLVKGALQRWLGDLIVVEDVEVSADEANLTVRIVYTNIRSQESVTAELARKAAAP